MKHIARKRFGQHFLSDSGVIDAIVRAIAPQPGEPMVEIGPGLAALTQPLVERLQGAGVKDVTLKVWPEARHEILNETNKDEVVADIVAFLM